MFLVQQRLSFGEMPSEMFQEHFGEERYLSRKIPILVGTSKSFQNMAVFSLRLEVPPPLKSRTYELHLVALAVQNRHPVQELEGAWDFNEQYKTFEVSSRKMYVLSRSRIFDSCSLAPGSS